MGRPESHLSGTDPHLLAFADDLRRLRQQAGSPSYRQLARQAHYSPSALSQAANGRAMPTLEVTLGFVRACGGDVADWERRWQALNAAINVNGQESRDGVPEILECAPGSDAPRTRQPVFRYLRIGLTVVTFAVASTDLAVRLATTTGPPAAASSQLLGKAEPIADGSDPNRSGCGTGAVTMAMTRVHFPTDQLSGEVELRYSPHCHSAWGRFEPAPGWKPGPGTMVTVWTIRPADQATQSYSVEFGGETIIGNMLMTARGCVTAEVTVVRGAIESPVATTACVIIS
ncbi:MAG TPA: helix-turn-helix domain-containing protein [Streptosporangiaceae bacterium]